MRRAIPRALEKVHRDMYRVKNALKNAVTVVISAVFPALFLYCQNAEEMKFSDISSFGSSAVLIALIVYVALLLLTRNASFAGVGTVVLSLFCLNYSYIEYGVKLLLPNARYWHIVPTVLVLMGFAGYQLIHSRAKKHLEDISIFLGIIMGTMTLMNLIPTIPVLLAKVNNQEMQVVEGVEGNPNIYWMTFDECASFEIIEKYYGLDSEEYQNKLTDAGFSISHHSDNVYYDTLTIMTNCMALDYIVDLSTSELDKEAIRMDSPLHQKLKEMQYSAVGIGDTAWLGFKSVTDNEMSLTKTMGGETSTDILIKQTVFAPFYKKPNTAYAQSIMNVFAYFKDENNYKPGNSTFYAVYACSPHVPFLFDRNGMAVSKANYENWSDPKYYLGRYEYIMNQIFETIDVILKNDPNSIIILGSDHGPRSYPGMSVSDKSKNLLAVYNCGKNDIPITGESTVDVLKQVFHALEIDKDGLES